MGKHERRVVPETLYNITLVWDVKDYYLIATSQVKFQRKYRVIVGKMFSPSKNVYGT